MTTLFGTDAPEIDMPPEGARFAHVALEKGIDLSATGLTYLIPDALADVRVGERVLVPLGKNNKLVPGYVTQLTGETDPGVKKTKPIAARDPRGVSLPADLIALARWIAGYYISPIGMVVAAMLPAAVKRGTGSALDTYVSLAEVRDRAKLTKLQQQVVDAALKLAEARRQWIQPKDLADEAGARSVAPVKQLIKKGVLVTTQKQTVHARDTAHDLADAAPWDKAAGGGDAQLVTLTTAQDKAVGELTTALGRGFSVHLLHGATGSGKTEVYLRVIDALIKGFGVSGLGFGPKVENSPAASDDETPNPKPQTPDPSPDSPGPPGVIVLVPEISLTPQTVARFQNRFSTARVAVLHSGLTAAQRHEQWRRIRAGEARIVVGARSAVFAPLPRTDLIIVDEEHDNSYKQDQVPRYHARDVAIKRAQLLGIPVLLGSATPSLESYANTGVANTLISDEATKRRSDEGSADLSASASVDPSAHQKSEIRNQKSRPRYTLHEMPDRVAGLHFPSVEIVDLIAERRARKGIHLMSRRLEEMLGVTLAAGGQAILLLNRRGYANYIACPDHACGWMMHCEFCDATMVYHKDAALPTGGLVRCHHCDAEQLLIKVCPLSGHKTTIFGLGTQKVEEELQRKFPRARILRMDSDTMRSAGDYHASLEKFHAGQVDVLLGTQMIAKGLDFPNVRLVGVISGDTALHLPDFRASERTFQLIAQVAGRAGRGEHPGHVVVQSFSPSDPAIVLAADHDYKTFAAREIALRADVGLPPSTRMARIVVRDKDHLACYEQAKLLFAHLERFNKDMNLGIRLRGPMPCPIARIAGYHRQQIEMLTPLTAGAGASSGAATLQKLLTALRNAKLLHADSKTAVDVDPVAML